MYMVITYTYHTVFVSIYHFHGNVVINKYKKILFHSFFVQLDFLFYFKLIQSTAN